MLMSLSSHQGSSAGKWNSNGALGLMSRRCGTELTMGVFMGLELTSTREVRVLAWGGFMFLMGMVTGEGVFMVFGVFF